MKLLKPIRSTGGLSQVNRPIRLRLWNQRGALEDVLLVKHVSGEEALCGGMEYRLQCVSTDDRIPLEEFIALPVQLDFVTDRGSVRSVCGIVAQASAGLSDGALATYRLVVRDGLSMMEQRTNTRIYRNLNEIDIGHALVREWRLINGVLASAFEIDTSGIIRQYPAREFTMQHNESDAAFLRRLWKRRGIAWFIRSGQSANSRTRTASPVHTLVLFDDPHSLAQNAAGTVRYHRDAATEARDSVFNWSAVRTLKPGSVSRQSWDYRENRMAWAQSPTIMKQGETGTLFAFSLDDYQIDAPHAGDSGDDYRRLGVLRMQRHEYEAKCFLGESGVRDFSVGEWFRLEGHAEVDSHPPAEREFVVTELSLVAENNLPRDIDERARRLLDANGWQRAGEQAALQQASKEREVRYTNRFTCVRRGVPIVPAYDPSTDLPRVQLQSALVVGPIGSEVHCDKLGRIKLRFPGTRERDHPRGGGASNTDHDSAWVRVATYSAGARWGSINLPRVGDEVLVDFLGGDPDKPVVVGRVFGWSGPPTFSDNGELPGNRFLAGIKTKEVRGTRWNQLRLDDTPGEISVQLASEHGHSQLNLGYLTHPRRDGQGQARGEGAELRSDKSIVIRAAHLMLFTTQAMLKASGKQLEREPLEALLEASQGLLQELGECAGQHQAMPVDLAPLRQLAEQLQAAEQGTNTSKAGAGPTGAPLIAQYAEGGAVTATPKSALSYAGRQQNIVAQQHIQVFAGQGVNINAGKGISMFAHREGIKQYARTGKVEIQAQQDSVAIAGDRDVRITASKGEVMVAAEKSLTLSCGGAFIRIADGKIELGCTGEFTAQAGVHTFKGAARHEVELPFFPAAEHINWLKLDLDGYEGAPMAGVPYTLHFANGQKKSGILDDNGLAEERNLPDTIEKVVYHNSPAAKDESRPPLAELASGLGALLSPSSDREGD